MTDSISEASTGNTATASLKIKLFLMMVLEFFIWGVGWGGSWRRPRRIGAARAKIMFFTSEVLPAAEAGASGSSSFAEYRPSLRPTAGNSRRRSGRVAPSPTPATNA